MPTRLLSGRLHISNSIRRLSPLEEIVFIHLVLSCDDYGRFYGDPEILKGHMFPGRGITAKQIIDSLAKLEGEDMIVRYSAEGLEYIQLVNWTKYQKPRAKESKYPSPPPDCDTSQHGKSDKPKKEAVTSKDDTPEFVSIPLNDGTSFSVTESAVNRYEQLYPSVDVRQELRNMVGWSEANPTKRKTKNGIARFITSWLSRKQDSGGTKGYRKPPVEPDDGVNPFKDPGGGL